MANIFIYQIFYDERSRAALDPGFLPLDNSSNERPDWREYYPIRRYLLNHKLEDGAYYGFLSPQFANKTKLTSDQVKSFVKANDGADVVLFCPHFDQSAFFLNVFEQGELHHAGLTKASEAFVKAIGIDVDLKTLVNDSSNTIFGNYFVARSSFWLEWFGIAEQLYARLESPTAEMPELAAATSHGGARNLELKVFLMERLATLLLSTNSRYKTAVYDPASLPIARLNPDVFLSQMIACDAFKRAYRRLGNRRYRSAFLALRDRVWSVPLQAEVRAGDNREAAH